MAADPSRWTYTPAEVAEHLGIAAQTVREMCREGQLRTVKFGKLYLIPRAEIQRLTGEALASHDDTSLESGQRQEKVRAARRLAEEIAARQAELERVLAELEEN